MMAKKRGTEKKLGIKEVAEVAGVSPTTVSRVLNDRGYISDETRKKVYTAMDQIGYYPNEIARALLIQRTYFVGVIVPSIVDPFHGELVQNLEANLSKNNYKMLLCNSKNNENTERDYIRMLKRNQVDGIIVGTHNDITKDYENLNMPVVAIDRYLGQQLVILASDNYRIGEMATQHLLERGSKNILCIRGDSRLRMPGNSRSRAYRDVIKKAGLQELVLEVPFIKSVEEKRKLIYNMLSSHPEIDGVFAGDDSLAVIVMQFARERGIRIPEDLKVIGVDGASQTRAYVPELTTIRQPIEEIAFLAVEKLIDLIEGRPCESQEDLPVELLLGKTT